MQLNPKQPIHRHSHQGKLYKITNRINSKQLHPTPEPIEPLLQLSPSNNAPLNLPKKHIFFLKQTYKRPTNNTIDRSFNNEPTTGAFRAIHTSNPLDTIKGFPLRSGTSLKPFRRGIRTSDHHSRTLHIDALTQQRPITRVPRARGSLSLQQSLEAPPKQEYIGKYSQQFEEFYVYQGSPRRQNPQVSKKVSGTRIEPFRKYYIRQWNKKGKE